MNGFIERFPDSQLRVDSTTFCASDLLASMKMPSADNSMTVTRRDGGWREDEDGKGSQIYSDRRLDFGW